MFSKAIIVTMMTLENAYSRDPYRDAMLKRIASTPQRELTLEIQGRFSPWGRILHLMYKTPKGI